MTHPVVAFPTHTPCPRLAPVETQSLTTELVHVPTSAKIVTGANCKSFGIQAQWGATGSQDLFLEIATQLIATIPHTCNCTYHYGHLTNGSSLALPGHSLVGLGAPLGTGAS